MCMEMQLTQLEPAMRIHIESKEADMESKIFCSLTEKVVVGPSVVIVAVNLQDEAESRSKE